MEEQPGEKTSLGLDQNIASLLCYLLTWVTGIVFLIIEKENRTVRFHAMQSVATFIPLWVIYIVAGFLPLIGSILELVVGLATLVLWIVLMVFAFQGKDYHLPIVGDFAEKQINKS
ncbi:MAG: DUF4870 domain-containing protein [Dehalococcoidia bacterium]